MTRSSNAAVEMGTSIAPARGRLLIADDEAANREILSDVLALEGYDSLCVADGKSALHAVKEEPTAFDALLLDRMMPHMTGIEVVQNLRAQPEFRDLPIIMQTAAGAKEDIVSGLEAGANYYLTKPLQMELLAQVVSAAVAESQSRRALMHELVTASQVIHMLTEGSFDFRTLSEGRALAALIAKAAPHPERVALGLSELMVNAVEHGNLGITYAEKGELNRTGAWEQEVNRRMMMPEYADKRVRVTFVRGGGRLKISIRDQGNGFDWKRYLEIDPARAFDTHGRGIAMALKLSFTELEYRLDGREVEATIAPS